jgi:polyphosphate kinase
MMRDYPEPGDRFFNRELSWLEFNHRVLGEAMRPETPLLERLKFLAISGSNLDEFFMVRVGGLLMQFLGNPDTTGIAGLSPREQLRMIRQRTLVMCVDQYRCLHELLAELDKIGIRRLRMFDLNEKQLEHLQWQFHETLKASCSAIAVRDSRDFPSMIGAKLGVCFRLRGEDLESIINTKLRGKRAAPRDEDQDWLERFVVVPIGRLVNRIMSVPAESGFGFVLTEEVIAHFGDYFFPGQTILEAQPFRASRNADVDVDLEGAADLLEGMQELLQSRNTSDCVRLEVDDDTSDAMTEFLQGCLEIGDDETYRIPGPLDLTAWFRLANMQGFREQRFEAWPPQPIPGYQTGDDIFAFVAAQDRLLVHPYDSYDPVVDLIKAASVDPKVIAIKQTLYRTSNPSEIVDALQVAADSGKHVTVILELKARFDERRNIDWARKLERSGVDVIYGVRGLKIHAKMCMIVRRESAGVFRYMHLGTGNYNESTARLYTDISLLTCNEKIGNDVVNLFNAITGLSTPQPMHVLTAAPLTLRERFYQLIDVEIVSARKGREGLIRAKFNSLVDEGIIQRLYEASQAGVRVELNVRGICCLKPGVPGLSENIRVVSIVDRFLEHMRIYYFLHGGDHLTYISSADWMNRNLDRRVELLVPILEPVCARRVIDLLDESLSDNQHAHLLQADGSWLPARSERGTPHHSQRNLYEKACQANKLDRDRSQIAASPRRSSDPA